MKKRDVSMDSKTLYTYLLVGVEDLSVALPFSAVVKITKNLPVTRLPFVEDYVDGLVNYEGLIIPQMNLGRYIFPDRKSGGKTSIIVEINDSLFSFCVDSIIDEATLPADGVEEYLDNKLLHESIYRLTLRFKVADRVLITGLLQVHSDHIPVLEINCFSQIANNASK